MLGNALSTVWTRLLAMFAALLLLTACAMPPEGDPEALAQYEEDNDIFEPINRYLFDVHDAIDKLFLKPVAHIYRDALPQGVRNSIRNFLRNAATPVVLVNDVFQGELERAGITLARFLINTLIGFGGFFDVASEMGLDYHSEDFGQTLATYGVGDGPYFVIPVLGPTNGRDIVGEVVDFFLDPWNYIAPAHGADVALFAGAVTEGIDFRSRNIDSLDQIESDSLDFYTRIRSLYRQRRWTEIRNGDPAGSVGVPGIDPGITESSIEEIAPITEDEQAGMEEPPVPLFLNDQSTSAPSPATDDQSSENQAPVPLFLDKQAELTQ